MKFLSLVSILFVSCLAFADESPVSMLTGREIFASLEKATKIDGSSNPAVRATYNEVRALLPSDPKLTNLKGPVVLAVMRLAARFCGEAINRDAILNPAQRIFHSKIDFRTGPQQLLQTENQQVLLDEYSRAFWKRTMSDNERKIYSDFISGLVTEAPNTPEQTAEILRLTCSTFATSVNFVVF